MDLKLIKELMRALEDSSLASLKVEEGDLKISLKKSLPREVMQIAAPAASPAAVPTETSPPAESMEGIAVVKAPLVGTLYRAKAEGEEPFVNVGGKVKAGDVLCLIEAMKMFSEIKAPCDGTVTAIHFDNGQLAEFDQELIYIKEA